MPWCGPQDVTENEDTSSKTTDVLLGLTKVKIAFFEVDPVTKAGEFCEFLAPTGAQGVKMSCVCASVIFLK